ncbi:OprO/OprP family phosphate-selective porin [Novosphingobium sp. 11B]
MKTTLRLGTQLLAGSALALASSPSFASAPNDPQQAEIAELREVVEGQKKLLQQQQQNLLALEARLQALEGGEIHTRVASAAPVTPSVVGQSRVAEKAALASASSVTDPPKTPKEPMQRHGLDVSWRDGAPLLSVEEGGFSFRPRGRLTVDASSTHGSRFDSRNITGTEGRTLRFGMEGTISSSLAYQIEADFADNDPELLSAFVTYLGHDRGNEYEISVGNRLSERGWDASTSSQNTPFMERSVVATAIRPEKGFFGLGLTGKYFGRNWHFAGQIAGDAINNPGTANDSLTFLGRAHWNPLKEPNATLHLGYWAFVEDISSSVQTVNFNAYIATRFNDNLRVSTGLYPTPSKSFAQGGEIGLILRSAYGYGEYGTRHLCSRTEGVGCYTQKAWAVNGGIYLTGERPPYVSRSGIWGRPNIKSPIGHGGLGALELAARYESLDYNDFAQGGDGTALTLGLNWYLNVEMKFMLNYVLWKTNNRSGLYLGKDDGNSIMARMQFAF